MLRHRVLRIARPTRWPGHARGRCAAAAPLRLCDWPLRALGVACALGWLAALASASAACAAAAGIRLRSFSLQPLRIAGVEEEHHGHGHGDQRRGQCNRQALVAPAQPLGRRSFSSAAASIARGCRPPAPPARRSRPARPHPAPSPTPRPRPAPRRRAARRSPSPWRSRWRSLAFSSSRRRVSSAARRSSIHSCSRGQPRINASCERSTRRASSLNVSSRLAVSAASTLSKPCRLCSVPCAQLIHRLLPPCVGAAFAKLDAAAAECAWPWRARRRLPAQR